MSQRSNRVAVAGVPIDSFGFDVVVRRILDRAKSGGETAYVVTPNAHHVALFQHDERFRAAYRDAFLVVPDGVPLVWASRILGRPLPGRVNGTDLLEALCAGAEAEALRVYFLGGRAGAAQAAALRLRARYPRLLVSGSYAPPVGFELDPTLARETLERVNMSNPHLLFVGLGAPKQEFWMRDNARALEAGVALGIGVSFELIGGLVPRAPVWMQRGGLEWLFRLVAEPRRLWKRYLFSNAEFCLLVVRQKVLQMLTR